MNTGVGEMHHRGWIRRPHGTAQEIVNRNWRSREFQISRPHNMLSPGNDHIPRLPIRQRMEHIRSQILRIALQLPQRLGVRQQSPHCRHRTISRPRRQIAMQQAKLRLPFDVMTQDEIAQLRWPLVQPQSA